MVPLLPSLAESLAAGFQASRQGCFLWASDAVIREFSDGADSVDSQTSNAVYMFYEQQAVAFLRVLNELQPTELPDGTQTHLDRLKVLIRATVIEDFFRLTTDAIRFFPEKAITSQFARPIFEAALSALTLQQVDPLTATLHYLRDLLSFGTDRPAISELNTSGGKPYTNSAESQSAVKQVVVALGALLVQRILTGMMFSFPGDCFPDASAVLMTLFDMVPRDAASWVQATIQMLPAGSMKPGEADRLMKGIVEKVQKEEIRKVRVLLQGQSLYTRRSLRLRRSRWTS